MPAKVSSCWQDSGPSATLKTTSSPSPSPRTKAGCGAVEGDAAQHLFTGHLGQTLPPSIPANRSDVWRAPVVKLLCFLLYLAGLLAARMLFEEVPELGDPQRSDATAFMVAVGSLIVAASITVGWLRSL